MAPGTWRRDVDVGESVLNAWRVVGAAFLLTGILSATGCLDRGVFRCQENRDCGPNGLCESTKACSFTETNGCQSGRRYGSHADPSLAGRCVDDACPANPVLKVRGGGAHACVVRQNGDVACWGDGKDGQLGDETTLSRSSVALVKGLGGAVDVVLGSRHTCALLQDGSVWCWGANESAQLGVEPAAAGRPTQVPGLTGVKAIAAGGAFTCAVPADGSVVCWGSTVDGQVETTPQPVLSLANIRALAARERHACALTEDGLVFCWGSNEQGELGDGTRISRREPMLVALPGAYPIAEIALGAAHTCALAAAGPLWCWGANQVGELGDGTDTIHLLPTTVSLSSVRDVAAAGHHTCASEGTGTVWCWGANQSGQLGEGTTSNINVPVPVTGIEDAADVTAGEGFACARRRDGTVWCWGDNRLGQLGNGTPIERLTPVRVSNLDRSLSVTAGAAHTCALRPASDGSTTTVCWGDNQAGQIGDGTRLDRPTPVPLKINLNALEVVAGALHTCLRGGDRSVWCWGRGGAGQLGISSMVDVPVPAGVPDLAGASRIAAGRTHTCALLQDVAWCWGANDQGQLGDGTNLGRAAPAAVPGPADIEELATGGAHTCARHADGTVTCWGRGTEGQLGDNQKSTSATPVPVSDLTNVVAIAAGGQHTCAVLGDQDQTVRCWGAGTLGQLGWEARVGHEIPSKVMNITRAVGIAAGENHACVRISPDGRPETPGSILCWGDNSGGQLGNGTHDTGWAPTAPVSIDNAIAVTAGGAHTCAIKSDQSVSCWGSDSAGQLGDGAILQHPTAKPTQISCP
jgi:alpha-tubulin suppressor-like RCC1 family protein